VITQQGKLKVSKLREIDIPVLAKWLSDPRVLRYYEGRDRPQTPRMIRRKFLKGGGRERLVRCIAECRGMKIAYLQFYLANKKEYELDDAKGVYAMDLFIGEPRLWGKGIGTKLVKMLLSYLHGVKKAPSVVIDPQVTNKRAVRCYEKCGFKKVKVLRRHEWHEGRWRDCWLMARSWTR